MEIVNIQEVIATMIIKELESSCIQTVPNMSFSIIMVRLSGIVFTRMSIWRGGTEVERLRGIRLILIRFMTFSRRCCIRRVWLIRESMMMTLMMGEGLGEFLE